MRKVKILAIAPYNTLADSIKLAANKREDIDLTVHVGDLTTGKNIAMNLAHNNYDVIVSRGGTAELIRSSVETPLVEINISVYDILRSIKMAENFSGKFLIAGFSGITDIANILCDLLQYDINIITFKNEQDAYTSLKSAVSKGYSLIISDNIGSVIANELNVNSILIQSGMESIDKTLDDCVKLVQSSNFVHKQKELFQRLLTEEDRDFLIYDPSAKLWFSSFNVEEDNIALMDFINSNLKSFLKSPNQKISTQIRNKVYTLINSHLYFDEQKYTSITIQKREAIFSEEDLSISIYNKSDNLTSFFNNYKSYENVNMFNKKIKEYNKYSMPILIEGEKGTGKDSAVYLLYENGKYSNSPLYTINCEYINDKKWNYLINSENSPLNSINNTIYFKKINILNKIQLEKLYNYIEQSNIVNKNHLIFSIVLNNKDYIETNNIKNYLINKLNCLSVTLPPLRELKKDIPDIITLNMHNLNLKLGKQIIGFESEAMEEMQNFSWPNNLDQLNNVLKELVIITNKAYINLNDVKEILNKEYSNINSNNKIDINKTLEEINYEIMLQVLQEENNNKEKASQRLGISRSTLWRTLKKYEK